MELTTLYFIIITVCLVCWGTTQLIFHLLVSLPTSFHTPDTAFLAVKAVNKQAIRYNYFKKIDLIIYQYSHFTNTSYRLGDHSISKWALIRLFKEREYVPILQI